MISERCMALMIPCQLTHVRSTDLGPLYWKSRGVIVYVPFINAPLFGNIKSTGFPLQGKARNMSNAIPESLTQIHMHYYTHAHKEMN